MIQRFLAAVLLSAIFILTDFRAHDYAKERTWNKLSTTFVRKQFLCIGS